MTDTDPGQYSDAIRTATDLARNVGRLARERDDAKAAIARVTAILDRTDGHGERYVHINAVQHAIDGSDQ